MNILLTSVGRRAYLVKYFKEELGTSGKVHVCNSDGHSVAFCYADQSVISPIIFSDEYIPFLIRYCKENQIDIVISLFDMDLPVLAQHKEEFSGIGTQVIVSDVGFISVCNDKWKTHEFLSSNGFHTPRTYLTLQDALIAIEQGEMEYPVIVKPRFGCGSIAVSVAEDEEELRYLYERSRRTISKSYLKYESESVDNTVLIQEYLQGDEYGADVINDLSGTNRCVNIRKKIAMRCGETDIAELVEDPVISAELERLGRCTHHIANLDVDLFMVDDTPYILEMNARFGGGYPFSHLGGSRLPFAILEWACGRDVSYEDLKSRSGIVGYKELYITLGEKHW